MSRRTTINQPRLDERRKAERLDDIERRGRAAFVDGAEARSQADRLRLASERPQQRSGCSRQEVHPTAVTANEPVTDTTSLVNAGLVNAGVWCTKRPLGIPLKIAACREWTFVVR